MILVDAGPLIAVIDGNDQHHQTCSRAFEGIQQPMVTVWPAFSEAMYFLADLPTGQDALWEMLARHTFKILELEASDHPRMRTLMRKYANRPMDLADAALVAVAEREDIETIFTVDREDFEVYRLYGRTRFKIIP